MVSEGLCFFPAISEDLRKILSLPPNHTSLVTTSLSLLKRCNFSKYEIMTTFQPALRETSIFLKSVTWNHDFGGYL